MLSIDLSGYIAKDCELKTESDGEEYASFSVCVSLGTKAVPVSEWVQCTVKVKLADVAFTYVKRGVKVWVRGKPQATSYKNSAGKTVNSLRVTAYQLEWFGAPAAVTQNTSNNNLNSDLPY